ncbi:MULTISPECIES: beta-propeller domain-containing protein [unclassified Janthinobacterium]|uniref:beta-propeller domain-containing protein n=1 Tax=unclassified Janthinobacterium TaxID=2610881 RepID=UPI000880EAD5|nr:MULTISPECIES: beta-propeller domain-containing protein [unclassified Janthinobacterium]SDA50123.1 Beta propeller domain-containing protein [Janthinobacterium sp. 551a]SFB43104.1 Beta propeller domain-containing protein [Janthinobacterium sp. 344]
MSSARTITLILSLLLSAASHAAGTAPRKTLAPFASEQALSNYLRQLQARQAALQREQRQLQRATAQSMAAAPPAAPAPMVAKAAPAPAASAEAAESVTNVQTTGVDEGGIVKLHGKHLVILRRGKLFTVQVGGNALQPVASLDAFAPGADPSGSWYDEMLVDGDTVAVIGYSYSRGGTEIGLFDINADGKLAYRATYHLRSNDYYSSRNYASRLIGSKLVFYSPLSLDFRRGDIFGGFPALRRWRPDAVPSDFKRIAPATHIYRTDDELEPGNGVTLHTVTVCDLAQRDMRCAATAVMGPQGRVFYVSGESVFVWTTRRGSDSGVFRIPLDGSAPSALKVAGAPVDQFSFLESGDGHLNVLLRAEGQGDAMWDGARGRGDMALLRVPLASFSDGRDSAPAGSYRPLPGGGGYGLQNRYVGAYLLYGNPGNAGRRKADQAWPRQPLYAVRWADAGSVQALSLPHGVERIEALGDDAVVIGAQGRDLHFSSIRLGPQAAVATRYIRADAAQGESRSHGFFYKPQAQNEGLLGLPILGADERPGLNRSAASVLYLRNSGLTLTELGALAARPGPAPDDGCRASCVDWYGNARPLFLQGRVFALLGYELVEGALREGQIREVRRISYAPAAR